MLLYTTFIISLNLLLFYIYIQHLRYEGNLLAHFASSIICIISRYIMPYIQQLKLRHKYDVTIAYSLFQLSCFDTPHSSFAFYLGDSTKPEIKIFTQVLNRQNKSRFDEIINYSISIPIFQFTSFIMTNRCISNVPFNTL